MSVPDADQVPVKSKTPERALEELLAAMHAHGGLPSVGHTLARLTRLLESDGDAVQVLADVILSDVGLTQRLLRIANTIPYRMGPQAVTTVTRAIMLLGFDQVRVTAMSVVLVEGLLGERLPQVRDEFHQSLLAGSLARQLLPDTEGEEASIAAMFRSVGRLLVALFAPQAHEQAQAIAQKEGISESMAARRVLGRSHDELTDMVLREWHLPDRILTAVQPLPARIDAPANGSERVRAAAQFAEAVAGALGARPTMKLDEVLKRFRQAQDYDSTQLLPLLERAADRTRDFEAAFGIAPTVCPVARLRDVVPQEVAIEAVAVETSTQRDGVGRPSNACAVLAAGIAEATDCIARADKVDINSVVQVALEAIFSGLGYARTAFALRDPASGVYRTRAGFGEPKAQFSFASQGAPNLFVAALAQGKDLHIADSQTDKMRANLPEWFLRDFTAARSFLLMPLVVSDKVIGFFYADRPMVDAAGLNGEELNLLRALRSQVVMAIRSR